MHRAGWFILMTLIGLGFVVFSINNGNKILVASAVLFTLVSFYNIFCGMRK